MKKPEINMIPMLDVLLVLVVVLLKSAHQVSADEGVPQSQAACVVRISSGGYQLDGNTYSADQIEGLLESVATQAAVGARVTLYAAESSVSCGALELLIRTLQRRGYRPVYTIK